MAYDYNNYEKFYNAMNDSQRAKWNEQNKNDADFNDFMSKYNAKNQTSTPVSTGKASSQTAVPEYGGTGASNAKQSNYVNQGEGNYKYNPTTGYYEKQGTSTGTTTPTTPTQTSTTSTTSSVSTPKSDTISSMKEYWDSLDYAQQQEKLKANPSLKEGLAKYGITSKTAPAESTGTTGDTDKTGGTTPADKWDYSDNSPERMAEIADNVNRFYNTNPGIFESEDSFRNFFIDGKGRTPEQEAFLMDFYKNRKKYNELDNYTADEIGAMDVHGYVPESYLTYLKNSDPERYAAVMDAKAKEQDKIKDKTSLETTNVMTGEDDENTITSKAIEWLKKQGLFVDKDGNFIDDRTENYATDEEKQYAKDAADIIARNLDIDNTVKHTYDDLVEKYPGATKATLMAMAQDINSDLLREKENNNVELTRLQGYMDYMQSERQERNKIGQNAIEQLQKQYGMYYDYSPEGMSELAQAQYAATNVTLDQADNGTDTQKQMALQSVLDDYYAKYGDIIQRSEAQVINDVMKLAKDKGITLSQALQENFITPLKSKPDYETLSTGRTISNSGTDKWAKLTDDKLFNTATGEIIDANGNVVGSTGGVGSTSQTGAGKSYTVVSSTQLVSGLSDFLDGYNEGDKGGQCGAFINNGLKKIGAITENIYDNSLDSKLKSKNEEADDTAQTGWVAIYDPSKLTGAGAQHGHVGWVVKDNGDGTVAIIDSNGTKNAEGKYDETVGYHPRVSKISLYGYFNPTKSNGSTEDADLYNAKVLSWIPTQLRNTDVEKQWYIDIAKGLREKGLSSFEAAMAIMGFDIKNNSPEAQATKEKILNTTMAQGDEIVFNSSTLASMAESVNAGDYDGALKTLENQLGKYISKQLGNDLSRDNMTEAMQAIADFDRINTNWTQGTWNKLSSYLGAEGGKTIQFNSDLSNLSATMRKLGYSEDEIENLLPKQSYNRTEFKKSIDTLQKNILNRYNMIRSNHGMPSESRASLLGNIPLSSVYGLNAEVEAMNII